MSKSTSILAQSILNSSILASSEHEQNVRQQLWDYKREISELQITLEAERKRNSHLEENYLKLPVNIQELQELNAELEISKTRIQLLENRLKDSEALNVKLKKDADQFRDYAFKEIKEKEFAIIEQASALRTSEAELANIKNQSTLLYEQFDQLLKKPNIYKQKYHKAKEDLRNLKSANSNPEVDLTTLKLELSLSKKKILDLTRSREELAKTCLDLEEKNKKLSIAKSEIKTSMHRQNRTLTEMEFDFKNVVEGLEVQKSEEVEQLLEKIAVNERIIKELKSSHEEQLALKQEEVMKEKFSGEELKRVIAKLEKDKSKVEGDLIEARKVIEDHEAELMQMSNIFEQKVESLNREQTEKILKYKGQIQDLEIKNKELIESNDIQRKSFLVGDSLFDELSELSGDIRDSRAITIKNFQESVFKQFEVTDNKVEKLNEKIAKMKHKKNNLKEELKINIGALTEADKKIRKLEESLKKSSELASELTDTINDLTHRINNMEVEKDHREKEIIRLKDQSQENARSAKAFNDQFISSEAEMAKLKRSFDENLEALKRKYSDKIIKYKEDIIDLTQTSNQLRSALNSTKSPEDTLAREQLETNTELVNENTKLKERVDSLLKAVKSHSEKITALQSKLREVYSIPEVDENLEDNASQEVLNNLRKDNEAYRLKCEHLEQRNRSYRSSVSAGLGIMVIKESAGKERREEAEGGMEADEKAEEIPKNFDIDRSSLKIDRLKDRIRQVAEEEFEFVIENLSEKNIRKGNEESPGEYSPKPSFSIVSHRSLFSISSAGSEMMLVREPSLDNEDAIRQQYESSIEALTKDYEFQLSTMKSELEAQKSLIGLINPSSSLSQQLQDLESEKFRLEQDLAICTSRLQKADIDLKDLSARFSELNASHKDTLLKLQEAEDTLQQHNDTSRNYTIENEYTESDEELNHSRIGRVIGMSVLETNEEYTEGSIVEEPVRNPFEVFKQSLLVLGPASPAKDNSKIEGLELEVLQKIGMIRQLNEEVKDLKNHIESLQKENNGLLEQVKESEKKINELRDTLKHRKSSEDGSNSIMHEAKMTLLEAHNQRLETELIISKTNWGELTNSLLKDVNDLEKQLNEARNDCTMLTDEKEILLKKINEKGWKFSDIFKRKKRNSDIN